jgi:molecular chaperone DnaJ
MATDYYDILGIPKTASQDEIKKAFRKQAHQHHPDKKGGNEAKFKELNDAYGVLSNPEKRKRYDQFGHTANHQAGAGQDQGFGGGFEGFDFGGFSSQGGSASGFEDIFSDLFGGGQSGTRNHDRTGSDIQVDIEVSFEEMVSGAQRDIKIRKPIRCHSCSGTGGKSGTKEADCKVCGGSGRVTKTVRSFLGTFAQAFVCSECHGRGKTYAEKCRTCHGAGRVEGDEHIHLDIPAGIENGQSISFSGKGAAGGHGSAAGDLLVTVHVRPHPTFRRHGDDIHSTLEIGFAEAALGETVPVETVHGPVKMKVPAGTQPDEVFRIRGKGVAHVRGWGEGDHLVTVKLVVPKHLSSEERSIIEKLKKSGK